jgi:hypothetical protein
MDENSGLKDSFFHTSVQHPVACTIEVTINTVYATLFVCFPLLEDVLFIAACFSSVEPSLGNVYCLKMVLLNRNMSQ